MSEIDIREPKAKTVRFCDNGTLRHEDEKRFSIAYGSKEENPNECIMPMSEIENVISALRMARRLWVKKA